uniref:Uncharacterized protein n=1 Tax=Physcomitrium patens TaxID=3218 RepID=A0A2K1J2F3_PHYPA|nr:hypothetical protein PHYPA_021558 [Physcomitrium patens]
MLDNVATVGFAGSRKPSHRDDAAAPAAMKEKKRRVLDWNSKIIFAPVEAFLQRCQDMLEVCVPHNPNSM